MASSVCSQGPRCVGCSPWHCHGTAEKSEVSVCKLLDQEDVVPDLKGSIPISKLESEIHPNFGSLFFGCFLLGGVPFFFRIILSLFGEYLVNQPGFINPGLILQIFFQSLVNCDEFPHVILFFL